MSSNNSEIEKRLWESSDELIANSKLQSSEYGPILAKPEYKLEKEDRELVIDWKKSKRTKVKVTIKDVSWRRSKCF